MYPYNINGFPMTDPVGRTLGMFPRLDPDVREYSEEVRQALENRGDEIHTAADLRDLAEEEALRQ